MLSTTSTRQLARAAAAASSVSSPSALLSRTTPAAVQHAMLTRRCYATPMGPPPKGFRQAPPKKWDEDTEATFDKLGKYFLLTEMARGMYVLLEQFFRPP